MKLAKLLVKRKKIYNQTKTLFIKLPTKIEIYIFIRYVYLYINKKSRKKTTHYIFSFKLEKKTKRKIYNSNLHQIKCI